jgi:hypothetical protein
MVVARKGHEMNGMALKKVYKQRLLFVHMYHHHKGYSLIEFGEGNISLFYGCVCDYESGHIFRNGAQPIVFLVHDFLSFFLLNKTKMAVIQASPTNDVAMFSYTLV